MADKRKSIPSANKSISIGGDVVDSVVIAGDNNVVNKTTIIQKFFNIFKSDAETLEQRNRRILLGHVENAWIKGVLDASLHGAALLDLGIKADPEAVTKYPWAIKKESTDETLPAGTSMLEIFDSIGMGRSLLILGAPGSGKTTMLLELARQLIQRAREDVTQPIPMVFNLASWTEKLTLADWLAQELNNLYSVPRKTAPDWVKGNKLLLLLDGLDEVRQESRAKCVEAINEFRKEHGLTSLAVCSRSQDYADLNAKLSFEGAIEVQPLTQKQITEFFNRFGDEMAGIMQALEKDSALREMAETPLFLSIMIMAYRDKRDVDILVSQDEKAQRKHLFDTYIERMFERPRLKNEMFKKQDVFRWLTWLAKKMVENNAVPYLLENMQPNWLNQKKQRNYRLFIGLVMGLIIGPIFGFILKPTNNGNGASIYVYVSFITWLIPIFSTMLIFGLSTNERIRRQISEIKMIDTLAWDWEQVNKGIRFSLIIGLIFGLGVWMNTSGELSFAVTIGLLFGGIYLVTFGFRAKSISQTTYPGQRIFFSLKNFLFMSPTFGLIFGLIAERIGGLHIGLSIGLSAALISGLEFGSFAIFMHYALRFILARNSLLPWKLVPFLNYATDLIFLRRVGGGYIFVHRLLMEHFAEIYVEPPTSEEN